MVVRSNSQEGLFYELVRVSIGTQDYLSHIPLEYEWFDLFNLADKQSMVGVCFAGLRNLGANADDGFERIGISESLYMSWMSMAMQVQQKNERDNKHCVELQTKLAGDSIRNYIMKGQCNSSLYGDLSLLRQAGDIDVYLEGGLERVVEYAKTYGETKRVNELEIHVNVFDDVEVEFHYRPFIMRNPFKNKKLQLFFKNQEESCFANRITLPTGETICAPTIEFNLVHQMVHIFHHLFTEGVGLRQLMDYYFLLNSVKDLDILNRAYLVVKSLGLDRFASALIWVLHEVFGMITDNLPWIPNRLDGEFLLNEIMQSGNFGKMDKRQKGLYDSKWNSFWKVNAKAFRLARFDHWMWFWGPLWRTYHFMWRKIHGFE